MKIRLYFTTNTSAKIQNNGTKKFYSKEAELISGQRVVYKTIDPQK